MIKTVIIALLLYTIYRQIAAQESLEELWSAFKLSFSDYHLIYLLGAIFLMPFNWIFESLKWRVLLRTRLSLNTAFKAVLGGVAVSLFTPNRIGEYGGRVLFVEAKHNWKAVIATMIGSIIQLAILLFGGMFGLMFYARSVWGWEGMELWWVVLLSGGSGVLLLLIFFNVKRAVSLLRPILRWKIAQRFSTAIEMIADYEGEILIKAMCWALLRYMTFCIQYVLLLTFFSVKIPLWAAFSGVATIFLIQAGVPLSPVMGLLARGELALFIWAPFSEQTVGILASTFSLFIINLAIPALVGMVLIAKTNLLKSLGYENNDE